MRAQNSASDQQYRKGDAGLNRSSRDRRGLESVGRGDRDRATSWAPHDPRPYLEGAFKRPKPSLAWMRDDQRAMLYPGRDHLVYGPTQSGKTMLALAMCADVICDPVSPGRVLYVHFEEPDGLDTFHRLQSVYTVPDPTIIEHFRFVSPERAARAWEIAELAADEPELVVLDGVNEALTMFGRGDGYSADNWALFRQHLIMPFLRAGAAVVALDHVSRTEGAGFVGPSGSVHKINACTGAAYYLVPHEDADEDHRGCTWVMVTKDRPGGVKRYGIRREGKRGVSPATYWGAMITDARAPNSCPLWIAAPKAAHLAEMDGDDD